MVSWLPKHSFFIFLTIAVSLGFASCTGAKSTVNTTWSLVKLVSVGNPIRNSTQEIIEVKNCGEPIEKTTTCSAGTSRDLNVSLTSGAEIGVVSEFKIEGTVGTSLGVGQESGESVRLPIPPDGFIYTYTVNKFYQFVTGQVMVRSSDGDEETANFSFNASCSIDIVDKQQTNCSGYDSTSNNQLPSVTVTQSTNANPLSARQSFTREIIDTALGVGNWKCFQDRLDGVLLINVPNNFVVADPIAEVDKLGIKYTSGQSVPSGGGATAWLNGVLSNRETQCPIVGIVATPALSSELSIEWPSSPQEAANIFANGIGQWELIDGQGWHLIHLYPPIEVVVPDGVVMEGFNARVCMTVLGPTQLKVEEGTFWSPSKLGVDSIAAAKMVYSWQKPWLDGTPCEAQGFQP